MLQRYADVPPYTTKDGSIIRELMHPVVHGNHNQSLAEATVPAGTKTLLHLHRETEELYHITAGRGRMTLGARLFDVAPGDTICIPPGTPHSVEADASGSLLILCCCSPAYTHADTEILDPTQQERQ